MRYIRPPIRVMRILTRLNVGGPAIHVSLLTAGMNDAHFASSLVVGQISETEGDMSYVARDRGIEPIIIPTLGREGALWNDLITLAQLVRLIRQMKPHIVETHTAKAGFLGRLAAAVCRVPVIIHVFHGHYFHGYFGHLKTSVFIALERLAARFSSRIVTVSDRVRDDLVAWKIASRDKIQVIGLALDLQPFVDMEGRQGKFRAELGCSSSTPLIASISRLVPIKNHEMFIQAMHHVVAVNPLAQAVIVGDGECRPDLEHMVQHSGLTEHVRFLGWRRDLDSIYSDLDLIVLTSLNEGTPVSIIEAMTAQVPVVATSVGGVPDLLENGWLGTLVAPHDAATLAQAILRQLEEGKDNKRLALARARAIEKYGIDRLMRDLKATYVQLLHEAGLRIEEG